MVGKVTAVKSRLAGTQASLLVAGWLRGQLTGFVGRQVNTGQSIDRLKEQFLNPTNMQTKLGMTLFKSHIVTVQSSPRY